MREQPMAYAPHDGTESPLPSLVQALNDSVTYVASHLNALAEEVEQLRLAEPDRRRLLGRVDQASDGAEQLGQLVRQLKALAWDQQLELVDPVDDDTWDADRQGARLLVIDDEPGVLAAVERALSNYQVVTAADGRTALAILDAGQPADLILLDVVMSGVSGIEIYEHLERTRPDLAGRVIFMTAGAFSSRVRNFLASKHNAVLHKPFDTKTLRWMIAQKLRGS